MLIAEVIETKKAYKSGQKDDNGDPLPLGSILIRLAGESTGVGQVRNKYASPAVFGRRIPLIGEQVIIISAPATEYSIPEVKGQRFLYLAPYNATDNMTIHQLNKLWKRDRHTGTSKTAQDVLADKDEVGYTFKKKSKKTQHLQPFEGDDLWEGRFGQSIRFTREFGMVNPPGPGIYEKKPTWKGKKDNDPLMILKVKIPDSTAHKYDIEDIGKDDSSLYLTTSQKLLKLKAGSKVNLDVKQLANWNKGSQAVLDAERVVLNGRIDTLLIGKEILTTGDKVLFQSKKHKVDLDDLMDYIKSIANELFKLETATTMLTTMAGPTGPATNPAPITKIDNVDFTTLFKQP